MIPDNFADYGTDYKTRAGIALIGLGGIWRQDVVYPTAFKDGAPERFSLDGATGQLSLDGRTFSRESRFAVFRDGNLLPLEVAR